MIPGLQPYYDIQISEGNKIIKKYPKRKCNSFVKQFLQILLHNMSLNTMSITDTGNNSRTISLSVKRISFLLDCAANSTLYGSVVGSGTNAVTINDYALQTLIAHGTGAGQLQYSAESFGATTTDSTTSYMVATRVFTNGSSGNVSINEIGLYCKFIDASTWYFCLIRDKLTSTVTLSAGQNMTLNYTLKITI